MDLKRIDFYFDFLSPYSYLAWKRKELLRQNGHQLNFVPVPMGSLFSKHDIKGPGEILAKRHNMLKACFLYAANHHIPFIPPKFHPFNPLFALRLATKECSGDKQEQVIDLLWSYVWNKEVDVSCEQTLKKQLTQDGFDGEYLVEKTYDKNIKQALKNNYKKALEKNIFGVPSFIHKDELYWGNDQMDLLLAQLSSKQVQWDNELYCQRLGL